MRGSRASAREARCETRRVLAALSVLVCVVVALQLVVLGGIGRRIDAVTGEDDEAQRAGTATALRVTRGAQASGERLGLPLQPAAGVGVEAARFRPQRMPQRTAASVSIDASLQTCQPNQSPMKEPLADILRKGAFDQHCSARVSFEKLMCALQCDAEEPELENAFRTMSASTFSLAYMNDLCKDGVVTALIWIYQGVPKFKTCGGMDHVPSSALFGTTKALLSALACISEVPDVIFALDTRDWAAPDQRSAVPAWLQPLPGVARYVGSPGHPAILLPTNAFLRATTHCNIGDATDIFGKLRVCRIMDLAPSFQGRSWDQRENTIFWRGSSTGVPLDKHVFAYLPRPALIRNFFNEDGFDVGFVGSHPPNSVPGYNTFFSAHKKPSVRSREFANYKYLLNCDGHTASWGVAQKLTTKSAILWIDSLFRYREFYYTHLRPWQHYIPIDADLSNLKATRDWLFTPAGNEFARALGERAYNLFATRLRPEATYCYLSRLLASMALYQATVPTPIALQEAGLDPATFEDIAEFQALKRT
ncbi:Protein O-glucosyltransferase 1 [Hondaea fermentalgiana]|uniref:Protein O-glucosyltransferase 1 n=1 Tax=Hondaea fermentalgiana TaxID=2315210 RepID=A0A2R5GM64_9STRA|nr:Protein O-glucosyltransferase 1 [Hondaea fermentalgiana]|eukprot:GBG28964.1 Protein O-glucosyltransferase 1 [Hondaea fermentalgiana]